MEPETIYLAVTMADECDRKSGNCYRCLDNRVYQNPRKCIENVRRYTLENTAAVVVILSFRIETGLTAEATYINGHTDALHTMRIRDCLSAYLFAVLSPITAYLDTVCRANAQEEGHNG